MAYCSLGELEMTQNAPLSSFSDEELMQLYQQGELGAFDHLYERHAPQLYGYLKAHSPSRQYADDLLQICFLLESAITKSLHWIISRF